MGVKLFENRSLERVLESVLHTKTVKSKVKVDVTVLPDTQNDFISENLTEKHTSFVLHFIDENICRIFLDLLRLPSDKLSKNFGNWKSIFDGFDIDGRCVTEINKGLKNQNFICLYSCSGNEIFKDQRNIFKDCFLSETIKEFFRKHEDIRVYQKMIFSIAIHGLVCQVENMGIQMLSPIFSKLRIGYKDLLSPTPEKLTPHRVKRTVPPEQDKELIQTPSSLLFVVLGWSGNAPTVTIEAYLPQAKRWFYIPQNIFVKRAYHGIVILGILIYVIGGFDGRYCHNTTFCFNIHKRRWYRRASMKVPRCYVTALGFKGMVYALGGYDGDERFRSCKVYVCGGFDGYKVLKNVEMYDPDQDQWTLISDMLGPRSGQVLISHKGKLLVIGGFNGEMRLRTVERFDEEKNVWVQHIPLLNARSNFAAVVLEDQLHVIGGYNGE
ncbi:Kelch-like protein 10 like protein [Argiope bruennichi]|uniref:Kelch-like protein 10 like protein n=1 Tax=Argiope bruennichi TaxID=94029 RepID=A0A8T0F1Y1_ARGBR|nr:Kelch-like protein 10 like protein [Argiope bruennichi]